MSGNGGGGGGSSQDTLYSCGLISGISGASMQAYFQINVLSNSGGSNHEPTSTIAAYYTDSTVSSTCLGLQASSNGGGGSQSAYALVTLANLSPSA